MEGDSFGRGRAQGRAGRGTSIPPPGAGGSIPSAPFPNFTQWLESIVSSPPPGASPPTPQPVATSTTQQIPSADAMVDLTLVLNKQFLSRPYLGYCVEMTEAQHSGKLPPQSDCELTELNVVIPKIADLSLTDPVLGDGEMYCVFIWNLPPGFTHRQLHYYFAPYGEMSDYFVETNLARVDEQSCAIIRYYTYASGRAAVAGMNGHTFDGYTITVVLYYPTWVNIPPLKSSHSSAFPSSSHL
ncbi:unnamed protein product [Hydatigera taeniaeformis]|uniref:RRM domain-containing protein n=1 Tax=Hydatigena taeniaeformis TaxID=6205 RepID=A0A0R3WKJ1_HYDTA|nr:unnamed protein product [Hydatigera taeniaeformis]